MSKKTGQTIIQIIKEIIYNFSISMKSFKELIKHPKNLLDISFYKYLILRYYNYYIVISKLRKGNVLKRCNNKILTSISNIPKLSKIFIYGTGKTNNSFFRSMVQSRADVNVVGSVDVHQKGECCGKKVYELSDFKKNVMHHDYDMIIVDSECFKEAVKTFKNENVDKLIIKAPPCYFKFIFVHIPKVAGIAIRKHLLELNYIYSNFILLPNGVLNGHASIFEIKNKIAEYNQSIDNIIAFAFVRNPWSRLVSLYFYHLNNPYVTYNGKTVKSFGSFEKFCEEVTFMNNPKEGSHEIWRATQTYYLVNEEGELLVDFVGKFENIDEDFKYVYNKIYSQLHHSISHKNKQIAPLFKLNVNPNTDTQHYKKYYNKKTWKIVREKFVDDVEMFYPYVEF